MDNTSTTGSKRHRSASPLLLSSPLASVSSAKTMFFGKILVRKFNVIWISISFFVLFSAYNTLQNFVTSLLGDLGRISLAVLYGTVAVTVFTAPFIVARFGERWTIIFGASCYVIYMVSLVKIVDGVVILCSVIIGFGAAIMWVSQGSYLAKNSPESERGQNAGIFWGIFQICNILGNLVAFFVFNSFSSTTLFVMFTIIGAAGVFFLLFLRAIPEDPELAVNRAASTHLENEGIFGDDDNDMGESLGINGMEVSPVHESSLSDKVKNASAKLIAKEILGMFAERHMLMLFPMLFWTGIEISFWAGVFPTLMDPSVVGFVLMFVGIGETLGGLSMGIVSDIVGRSITMLVGVSVYIVAIICTITLYDSPFLDPQWCVAGTCAPWSSFVAAFCFGFADSIFNTQLNALAGQLFSKKSVSAFCVYQFVQNVGSAIGFYYPTGAPLTGDDKSLTQIYFQGGLIFVATILFIIVDRSYNKMQREAKKQNGWDGENESLLYHNDMNRNSRTSAGSSIFPDDITNRSSAGAISTFSATSTLASSSSNPNRSSEPTRIPNAINDVLEAEYNGNGNLLELILSNGPLLTAFIQNCRKMKCEENIDMAIAVDNFRQLPVTPDTQRSRLDEAQRIVQQYMEPGCPQPVSVDSRLAQRLMAHLEQSERSLSSSPFTPIDLPSTIFDDIDRIVRFYLKNDVCPRFVQTGEFRRAYAQFLAENQRLSL